MKMTRAEKRRRKIAKIVEMRLDGVEPPRDWRSASFEQLYEYHKYELAKVRNWAPYYGKSLMDNIMAQKAQELQRSIDRAVLEEMMNGNPVSTD